MRFSIVAIVIALTASMSVDACTGFGYTCNHDSECCEFQCYSGYCGGFKAGA
ncbi:hypothetical protein K503DRAFT_774329 [Rhizopogon vinicolor AM-OR11-026]|uniref:Uncharacterized protein n=1 Tax=Rhizopogon vinicolor AM-OR11-026 TaxID=1314800 RepID=A0A1B7MPZ6_9AGAM|nr:hypothetical protein K503DRAFT_774329 [Rhizopogon vinicolor AM-OR11-026]